MSEKKLSGWEAAQLAAIVFGVLLAATVIIGLLLAPLASLARDGFQALEF